MCQNIGCMPFKFVCCDFQRWPHILLWQIYWINPFFKKLLEKPTNDLKLHSLYRFQMYTLSKDLLQIEKEETTKLRWLQRKAVLVFWNVSRLFQNTRLCSSIVRFKLIRRWFVNRARKNENFFRANHSVPKFTHTHLMGARNNKTHRAKWFLIQKHTYKHLSRQSSKENVGIHTQNINYDMRWGMSNEHRIDRAFLSIKQKHLHNAFA